MNIIRQSIISLLRDWRSGELRLIAFAIVIAVASLSSVHFFTDRVKQATERQATELLAADLVLRSAEEIDQTIMDLANSYSLLMARTTSFRSVVVAGEKLQISEVKAIESAYPIRGKLRTADILFGEESVSDNIPALGTVWADSRLLQILGLNVGATIGLGAIELSVSKVLTYEPDRGGDLFNIAPRLMINLGDLPATKLIFPGSRAQYRLLIGGEIDAVSNFRREVETDHKSEHRIQGIRDARPELKRALERAEQFLGLAALVSVALAGLGVAMSAQRYAVRHFDNCAIMRCLGAEQVTITRLYLIQLLLLSILSSLLGCGIGYFAQEGISILASGFTKEALPSPSFLPVGIGLATGIITVLGFALPQILRLREVSPLRVLRRDLTPVPLKNMTSYVIAVIALALLTPWQSGNSQLTLYIFFGIFATAVVLMVCANILINWLNRLCSKVGVAARFGLSNVARRKNQSVAQILGIGLGVMAMILLTLIRTDLLANWRDRIPEGAPNYFLINIQPDEVPALKEFLQDNGADSSKMHPMIRARLTGVNGVDITLGNIEGGARRRLDRTYNLSWSAEMQEDNKLAQGKWWTGNVETDMQISLEEDFARDRGLTLGDAMTFDIAGRVVTGTITSTRFVDWDSFSVNFFVVASPGSLDGYPGTWVTSFFLQPEKRQLMIELIKRFPSVTVMDVDAIMSQVRIIMNQVIKTVEFVFGFTLLAGFLVLMAALQTTHDERSHESALLSSLGANRQQILFSLIAEFLILGLVAGLLAAFAATIIEAVLADVVFKMDVVINLWVWLIAPIICVVVIVIGGLAGCRKVLKTPPIVALRNL